MSMSFRPVGRAPTRLSALLGGQAALWGRTGVPPFPLGHRGRLRRQGGSESPANTRSTSTQRPSVRELGGQGGRTEGAGLRAPGQPQRLPWGWEATWEANCGQCLGTECTVQVLRVLTQRARDQGSSRGQPSVQRRVSLEPRDIPVVAPVPGKDLLCRQEGWWRLGAGLAQHTRGQVAGPQVVILHLGIFRRDTHVEPLTTSHSPQNSVPYQAVVLSLHAVRTE